jgi:hypothetical protein
VVGRRRDPKFLLGSGNPISWFPRDVVASVWRLNQRLWTGAPAGKRPSICSIRVTGKPSPCLSWGNTRLQLTTRLGAAGFLIARTQGVFIRGLHLAPASVSPDPISRTRWLSISTSCGRTLVLQRTRRNLFGPWPRSCHQRMAGRSSQTWNHRKQSCVSIS